MKTKIFLGYFRHKKYKYIYSKYRLRTDEDNGSRLGMIRKFSFNGIYYHPCCNGGCKSGNLGRFKTKELQLIKQTTTKPQFTKRITSSNIGVKNFKKSSQGDKHG